MRKFLSLCLAFVLVLCSASTLVACAGGSSKGVAVAWNTLTADGVSGAATTTKLTLIFDKDPATLAAANITVTGATKGLLTGTGTTRMLAISAISIDNGENLTVTISNPSGYKITPSSKTVAVNIRDSAGSSPDKAIAMETGKQYKVDDFTYFKFVAAEKGIYSFTSFDITGIIDPLGYLYDAEMTEIAHDDDGNGYRNFEIKQLLEADVCVFLFASIFNYDFDGESYYVGVDYFGEPIELDLGVKKQVTDHTHFSFTPAVTGIYTFASFDKTGSIDPYGYLYDNKLYSIAYGDDADDDDSNFAIGPIILHAGESVFLFASTWREASFNGKSYYVIVQSIGEPSELDLGVSKKVTARTYFSFTPATTGLYSFTSFNETSSIDPYGYLYDNELNEIAHDDDSSEGRNFTIGPILIKAGKSVFLYATNAWESSFDGESYYVSVDYLGAPIALDLHDAKKVTVHTYFAFTPTSSGLYSFSSFDETDDIDPYGYLYDDNYELVDYNDDAAGFDYNFQLIAELVGGETYYLFASTYDNHDFEGESYWVVAENYDVGDLEFYFGKEPDEFAYGNLLGEMSARWSWYGGSLVETTSEMLDSNGYLLLLSQTGSYEEYAENLFDIEGLTPAEITELIGLNLLGLDASSAGVHIYATLSEYQSMITLTCFDGNDSVWVGQFIKLEPFTKDYFNEVGEVDEYTVGMIFYFFPTLHWSWLNSNLLDNVDVMLDRMGYTIDETAEVTVEEFAAELFELSPEEIAELSREEIFELVAEAFAGIDMSKEATHILAPFFSDSITVLYCDGAGNAVLNTYI